MCSSDLVIDRRVKGLDLGLGAAINYGPSEHQASHKIWGSVMDAKGVYQNLELD